MKIEVKIESTYQEPKVIIFTDHMTDEVNEIIRKLSESIPQMIAGFQGNLLRVIDQDEVFLMSLLETVRLLQLPAMGNIHYVPGFMS